MLNMCTAVRTNFKLLYDKFHPPFRLKKNEKPFHQQGAKENKALHNQEAPFFASLLHWTFSEMRAKLRKYEIEN